MAGDAKGSYISRIWGSISVGFEQITIEATAKVLTAAEYKNAQKASISVETADIRYRLDGTAPTATIGKLAEDGDEIILESAEDIKNFKAIRTGSVSAVLNIDYSL
jgi:hypothetical protein